MLPSDDEFPEDIYNEKSTISDETIDNDSINLKKSETSSIDENWNMKYIYFVIFYMYIYEI